MITCNQKKKKKDSLYELNGTVCNSTKNYFVVVVRYALTFIYYGLPHHSCFVRRMQALLRKKRAVDHITETDFVYTIKFLQKVVVTG